MELSKELREKIEKAASAEEAKKILEEAGVELTDAEMDQVAGGFRYSIFYPDGFPIQFPDPSQSGFIPPAN